MDELFFSLIQVSIGRCNVLARVPTSAEWDVLFELAGNHSLTGICFLGIVKILGEKGIKGKEDTSCCYLSKEQYYQWAAALLTNQIDNEKVNKQCSQVEDLFRDNGFECCVLKGQGVGSFYGDELSMARRSGDIDIWVNESRHSVMRFVNSFSPNKEFDLKHTHLKLFKDTPVEVHWWPSVSSNPFVNFRLRHFYRSQVKAQCCNSVVLYTGETVAATTPFFNSIYLLIHIYSHYLYEGIGLRQFMDYYYTVVQPEIQGRKNEIVSLYKSFGLYSFARSTMLIMKRVFNLEDRLLLVPMDISNGEKLLREVIQGGNYGLFLEENDVGRENWLHRMCRRMRRKIRLIRYNPLGVLFSPFYKLSVIIWKQVAIKKYGI